MNRIVGIFVVFPFLAVRLLACGDDPDAVVRHAHSHTAPTGHTEQQEARVSFGEWTQDQEVPESSGVAEEGSQFGGFPIADPLAQARQNLRNDVEAVLNSPSDRIQGHHKERFRGYLNSLPQMSAKKLAQTQAKVTKFRQDWEV